MTTSPAPTLPTTCRCGLVLYSLETLECVPQRRRMPCGHCDRPCPDPKRCPRCQNLQKDK